MLTKVVFRWDWDILLIDLDGSLGKPNDIVVATDNITFNNPNCRSDPNIINGSICSNTKGWIRFAFNNLNPDLVLLTNITNSNNQMATTPKLPKRLTNLNGFMVAIEANQAYTVTFDEAPFPTNVSYTGTFYNIMPGEYVIMQHIMHKKPDVVTYGRSDISNSESLDALLPTSPLGSWHWDNSSNTLR